MNRDWTPDVVDANTTAWDTFTASLDATLLELERTHRSAPLEVVMHDLQGERFGSKRHNEFLWRHEFVKARSRKVLDDYRPEPIFTERQLQVAMNALNGVGGFAKGHTGDVMPESHTDNSSTLNGSQRATQSNTSPNERNAA